MREYRKEIIIVILQAFMHCVFPVFAGPGDEMGLVLILIVSTFLLSLFMGSLSKKRIKYAYPFVPAVLLVVTTPVYYNASALIHAVWYFVISVAGILAGTFIALIKELIFKS